MKRPARVAGLVFSIVAALYSLLGVAMAVWVAGVPGNTPGHVRLNFLVWVPATVVFTALSIAFAWKLVVRDD